MWEKAILGRRLASRSETCKTNPIRTARPGMDAGWRASVPGRRAIVRNEPNLGHRGKKSGGPGAERHCMSGQPTTREMRKTNPIGPPRRPVPEEIVRNEAKLG